MSNKTTTPPPIPASTGVGSGHLKGSLDGSSNGSLNFGLACFAGFGAFGVTEAGLTGAVGAEAAPLKSRNGESVLAKAGSVFFNFRLEGGFR